MEGTAIIRAMTVLALDVSQLGCLGILRQHVGPVVRAGFINHARIQKSSIIGSFVKSTIADRFVKTDGMAGEAAFTVMGAGIQIIGENLRVT